VRSNTAISRLRGVMSMTSKGAAGLIVAAPRSGAGKTTLALGLMSALTRRGLIVQPFKCGPDYIDPAFHAAATGRASFNLDTWSMRRELIMDLIGKAAVDADICIAEGVMGLFDGARGAGRCGKGSTADLAALTGWPVILVLDVSAQAETAAAVALGCKAYRDDIRLAGVILNRVASSGHADLIRPAIERVGLPVFGAMFRRESLVLPDRHLGLVQASELAGLQAYLDALSEAVTATVSLDALASCASPAALNGASMKSARKPPVPPPGQRIALAEDQAFSFTYPHILKGWREAGAEIEPFSPLKDEPPDATADAIWLPGGYPELHAGALSGCARFHKGLREAAARSVPIHGECGGYMALGAWLEDAAGVRHQMAGLLGLETSFARRKLHLGYRRARLLHDCALGQKEGVVFGHEFHYASVLRVNDDPLLDLSDAAGSPSLETGSRRGSVTGTFFHAIDGGDG
jgi:cobyrinic acid a,c-diamide synthase